MSATTNLLEDLDRLWTLVAAGKIDLRIIGASALLLQSDYDRVTKDSDVIETDAVGGAAQAQLLALAGQDTPLALKHRLYIDPVAPALPFLPQAPQWHLLEMSERLKYFDVYVLDVVDVVVSKIFRSSPNDKSDIDAMIERELVEHSRLLSRFRSAVDMFAHDAHSDDLPQCIENFHAIERDSFGVVETAIELPSWIDEG